MHATRDNALRGGMVVVVWCDAGYEEDKVVARARVWFNGGGGIMMQLRQPKTPVCCVRSSHAVSER